MISGEIAPNDDHYYYCYLFITAAASCCLLSCIDLGNLPDSLEIDYAWRRMLDLPSRADLINAVELCFTGISLRCFSKFIGVAPSDSTMIGITFALVFHCFCIYILRL